MNKDLTRQVTHNELLASAPLAERVAAWSRALPLAAEGEQASIALGLFEVAAGAKSPPRDRPAGPIELLTELPRKSKLRHARCAMDGIVGAWSKVPVSVRPLVGGLARQHWLDACAAVAGSPDASRRLNAARFILDIADPGMARTAVRMLTDSDSAVRLEADRALLRLVLTLLTHVPADQLGPVFAELSTRQRIPLPAEPEVIELERVELCRAVADAAWSFADHRCRAPLIGSLLLLDRLPGGVLERPVAERIRRLLKERHHPSHAPIRSVLRGTPSPLLRERAFRWIVLDGVASVCVDRLADADSREEHEIVLRRSHLALRRLRGSRLKKLRVGLHGDARPLPTGEQFASLSTPARLGAVRLAQLVGLDEGDRRRVLEPTLADPDARVRLAGLHAAHTTDLSDYTFDNDSDVAASAALRWSTLGVDAPRVGTTLWDRRMEHANLLARSPHAAVRDLARDELERLDPFAGTPAARLSARRLAERDHVAFIKLIRERLHNERTIMAALDLVRALALGPRFEMDLLDLAARHSDDRVRATSIAILGACHSEDARRVVLASLHAPDARVRSNAVESAVSDAASLLEFKRDESSRVCASAVRRVLCTPDAPPESLVEAGEALIGMLTDDNPGRRLSGAWAAERSIIPGHRSALGPMYRGVVRSVVEAAGGDDDGRVRERASRCVRLLGFQEEPAQGAA